MVNRERKPVLPTWIIGLWAVFTIFICIFSVIALFLYSQKNVHSTSKPISPSTFFLPSIVIHDQPTPTETITPTPTPVPSPTATPTPDTSKDE